MSEPSTAPTADATPDGDPTTAQKLAAEALGTFVLVLLGCGSVALAVNAASPGFGGANIVSVGLTFGIAVMVMIYAVGRVSGGHFNPAITLGAAISGRMAWREVPGYMGAQVGGGIVAAAVLLLLATGTDAFEAFDAGSGSLAANSWGDDGSGYPVWAALLVEIIMTLVFVFVVLAVTDPRTEHPGLAPLAIGFALAAIHFVTIPLTGTSVNPARSIGPALLSGADPILQLWVFILGPLLGGALAGLAYPALFGRDAAPLSGSGLAFLSSSKSGSPAGGQPWQQQGGYAGGYGQAPQQGGQPGYGQQAPQQGGYQGYAAPAAGQGYPAQGQAGQGYPAQGQQAGQGSHAAQAQPEQPIIQDGWQWDPQAQQWIPAQQPGNQGQGDQGGGGATQIR